MLVIGVLAHVLADVVHLPVLVLVNRALQYSTLANLGRSSAGVGRSNL